MKTFTATQLNKEPQEVFISAKEEEVFIQHDRHRNGRFVIKWEPSYSPPTFEEIKAVAKIMDSLDVTR